MSSTTTAEKEQPVKNHGIIRYTEPPPKPERWMPRALKSLLIIEHGNMSAQQKAQRYGYYPMVANRTICLSGKMIQTGERFTVTGNTAANLFYGNDADFISDGRREKELAVEKAAAELGVPINLQNEPAFTNPALNEFPDAAVAVKRRGHILG